MQESDERAKTLGIASLVGALAATVIAAGAVRLTLADEDGGKQNGGELAAAATLAPEERDRLYHAGPAWDGRGGGPMAEEDVKAFRDYPLLWLGESFAGYNLQWIGHVKGGRPGERDARDAVTFVYGTCTPYDSSEPSCPAPITVHVRPLCSVTPASIPEAFVLTREKARGRAELVRFRDGHVMLWTEDISVEMHLVAAPERVDDAIAALRGVGWTSLRAGAELPSPRFGRCGDTR